MTKEGKFLVSGEKFYWCDPDKAVTCEKRTCFRNGGNCALTMRKEWGYKLVTTDYCEKPRIK